MWSADFGDTVTTTMACVAEPGEPSYKGQRIPAGGAETGGLSANCNPGR
jgi:hypothetical protein